MQGCFYPNSVLIELLYGGLFSAFLFPFTYTICLLFSAPKKLFMQKTSKLIIQYCFPPAVIEWMNRLSKSAARK